jgi:hypothetical protein
MWVVQCRGDVRPEGCVRLNTHGRNSNNARGGGGVAGGARAHARDARAFAPLTPSLSPLFWGLPGGGRGVCGGVRSANQLKVTR